ncbi:MAG TPA: hypothetical protein VEX67_06380 [Solirubrobacteraceae bacterium]|nr:hypothetical protein [Solirubrobacteraceae bacterium]
MLVYARAQYRATDYFGFTDGRGWALYARVAPFADCTAFTPPAGTRVLCEKTDARTRSGPDHYMWDADSPAMRVVGGAGPPTQDELMGRFGRAAALGSPRPMRARSPRISGASSIPTSAPASASRP